MSTLQAKDYLVFLIYFIIVASYGYWIYRRKKKTTVSAGGLSGHH